MTQPDPTAARSARDLRPRILFVDDEAAVLGGIRVALRRFRLRWEMAFAEGASEALELIEAEPFDVVVTDMRMPGMSGADLLQEVQRRTPQAARIVLSGHSDDETARRAVQLAHQWLAKPCDAVELSEALERALTARQLHDPKVREIVASTRGLPTPEAAVLELAEALGDPNVELDRVAEIIGGDPSLCARVVQVSNSAFFALPREVADVKDAVVLLGVTTIADIVLGSEIIERMGSRLDALDLVDMQRRSRLASSIARRIAPEGPSARTASMAAMLSGVGRIALAHAAPESMETARREASRPGTTLLQAERNQFGVSSAQVGGALLGIWALPLRVVEAVGFHQEPSTMPDAEWGAAVAVHVARALVEELLPGGDGLELDLELLGALGVLERVDGWRVIAQDLFDRAREEAA